MTADEAKALSLRSDPAPPDSHAVAVLLDLARGAIAAAAKAGKREARFELTQGGPAVVAAVLGRLRQDGYFVHHEPAVREYVATW